MEDIERNSTLHLIKKTFWGALTKWKFTGITMLNDKSLLWRKLMFHLLSLFVLVNTVSVSMLSEDISYFQIAYILILKMFDWINISTFLKMYFVFNFEQVAIELQLTTQKWAPNNDKMDS